MHCNSFHCNQYLYSRWLVCVVVGARFSPPEPVCWSSWFSGPKLLDWQNSKPLFKLTLFLLKWPPRNGLQVGKWLRQEYGGDQVSRRERARREGSCLHLSMCVCMCLCVYTLIWENIARNKQFHTPNFPDRLKEEKERKISFPSFSLQMCFPVKYWIKIQ